MDSAVAIGDGIAGVITGINHGKIKTSIHYAAPSRPDTPPKPTYLIPFNQDKDFVRPRDTFDRVQDLCAKPAHVALVGLGGIGKSQIAIEYAHQIRKRSPSTWVFWIHASNADRYKESVRKIVDYVKIPGWDDARSNIHQLLHDWLCSHKSGEWLIILDNADDTGVSLDVAGSIHDKQDCPSEGAMLLSKHLRKYLPHCDSGSILITSRSEDVSRQLVEEDHIVSVTPMSRGDAVDLAQKKLELCKEEKRLTTTEDELVELVSALEYMPLAIVQATAYISKRAPRCSVEQYIEKLRQSDEKKTSLLDKYKGGELRRDHEANNSIILTWQISFDQIRETRTSAADLLSLMSFCDRQGIPELLLTGPNSETASESNGAAAQAIEHDDSMTPDDRNSAHSSSSSDSAGEAFEDDVITLRDYSFISIHENKSTFTIHENESTFTMHSLVQLSTRKWLKAQEQHTKWQETSIHRLCSHIPPDGKYRNWPTWHMMLPHAKAAMEQRPKSNESLRDWATILDEASAFLLDVGEVDEAETMSAGAKEVRVRMLGREHEESLLSMIHLSQAYLLQDRLGEAEKLQTEILGIFKLDWRDNEKGILVVQDQLAATYMRQCRWDEAERLEAEVFRASQSTFGIFRLRILQNHDDRLERWNV